MPGKGVLSVISVVFLLVVVRLPLKEPVPLLLRFLTELERDLPCRPDLEAVTMRLPFSRVAEDDEDVAGEGMGEADQLRALSPGAGRAKVRLEPTRGIMRISEAPDGMGGSLGLSTVGGGETKEGSQRHRELGSEVRTIHLRWG